VLVVSGNVVVPGDVTVELEVVVVTVTGTEVVVVPVVLMVWVNLPTVFVNVVNIVV